MLLHRNCNALEKKKYEFLKSVVGIPFPEPIFKVYFFKIRSSVWLTTLNIKCAATALIED